MNFRNAILFAFPLSLDLTKLEEALQLCPLKPVQPLEMASRGFIPPLGGDTELLAIEQALTGGNVILITLGTEEKILPGAVIAKLLKEKLDAFEKAEGRKPGGRTRKRIREDLIHELLPKAFVRPGRIDAILDLSSGILAVGTSSRKQAESVASEIRLALGSFPALPVSPMVSPRSTFTGWFAGEPMPALLSMGDEFELKDAMDGGAVVKYQHQGMDGDEMDGHLAAGKQVTKLGLTYSDRVSFTIDENLTLRKIKLLDTVYDQHESDLSNIEDAMAYHVATFLIFAGELRTVIGTIGTHLRFAPVE